MHKICFKGAAKPTRKPFICGLNSLPVRELHAGHRAAILAHFLLLEAEDRRLRFGLPSTDVVIQSYVAELDFKRDAIFGIFDTNLKLIAIAHLAYLPVGNKRSKAAEFGVSVLAENRYQGCGAALLERAIVHARNTQVTTLFVHCLAQNKIMVHLALKAGMQIDYAYGEAEACLKLPPANSSTIFAEAVNVQLADFDFAVKSNLNQSNKALRWLLKKTKAQ
ncbi:GNAT family N-acetyltransferase [Polynucleobacter sp. IMCC 29146]|uniref:GNAT family N-acetyltransferase n=1 Tax=Polynucleobacter sp. IMCC 29146 TaxID=2780953 RepID=UPI001F2AA0BB|nr:GNAT family N-acetyltransferase [Polynucleobacter sp. IMCC 29146]MCE7528600.1 GNAT family N-acetyltransferase [Polynucleobacter sp. IMCC 29146]